MSKGSIKSNRRKKAIREFMNNPNSPKDILNAFRTGFNRGYSDSQNKSEKIRKFDCGIDTRKSSNHSRVLMTNGKLPLMDVQTGSDIIIKKQKEELK